MLRQIGTVEDTPALTVLLSSAHPLKGWMAAETIAILGAERDLFTLDVWLTENPKHLYFDQIVRERDRLAKRLKDKSDGK